MTLSLALGCLALQARAERQLAPGQVSQIVTIGIDGSDPKVVFQTADLVDAPNWTPDGKWLVYNSQGHLWKIPAEGRPGRDRYGEILDVNNDHVLSPDGKTVFSSARAHI